MSENSNEDISSMKRELNNYKNRKSQIEKKIENIGKLQSKLNDYNSIFSQLIDFASSIISSAEDGKSCFIRGACYCGEEIGSSEVFQNICDYFTEFNDELSESSGKVASKLSLCDGRIKALNDELSYVNSKIHSLNSQITG